MDILVYGGTGSQGGAVVQALLERGHTPHVLTRNPEKAQPWVEKGAVAVEGNLADKDSLVAASKGKDAISFMVPAFLPDPSQAPVFAHNAIDAAKEADVDLLVYNTSGTVINEKTGNPMYDMRLSLIAYLEDSGVPFISIEPTAYMENLLGPWTRPNVVENDTLSYPVEEDTSLGWIATRDVGAFIAEALQRPDLANRRIGISGKENLTGPELAARFSEALGRDISYYAMPLKEFGAALDEAFGPGAGEGGIKGYQFQRDNADLLTMWWDMEPVLELLPVEMTSVVEWVKQHEAAFSAPATADTATEETS
jgi:uncharacterized protein YbjT (DUF2867 family)